VDPVGGDREYSRNSPENYLYDAHREIQEKRPPEDAIDFQQPVFLFHVISSFY
jgi:hypothetical protein